MTEAATTPLDRRRLERILAPWRGRPAGPVHRRSWTRRARPSPADGDRRTTATGASDRPTSWSTGAVVARGRRERAGAASTRTRPAHRGPGRRRSASSSPRPGLARSAERALARLAPSRAARRLGHRYRRAGQGPAAAAQHRLARPPDVPGYDLASHYAAAREIGGDFFELFRLPRGAATRSAIVIADVTGKGLDAALLMAFARPVMHSALNAARGRRSTRADEPRPRRRAPGHAVHHRAVRRPPAARPATSAIASAGHEPPLLVPGDGGPIRPVGRRRRDARRVRVVELAEAEMTLAPGDTLAVLHRRRDRRRRPVRRAVRRRRLLATIDGRPRRLRARSRRGGPGRASQAFQGDGGAGRRRDARRRRAPPPEARATGHPSRCHRLGRRLRGRRRGERLTWARSTSGTPPCRTCSIRTSRMPQMLFGILEGRAVGRAVADDPTDPHVAAVQDAQGIAFVSRTTSQAAFEAALADLRRDAVVGLAWPGGAGGPVTPDPPANVMERLGFDLVDASSERFEALRAGLPTASRSDRWTPTSSPGVSGVTSSWAPTAVPRGSSSTPFGLCLMRDDEILAEAYAPFIGRGVAEVGMVTAEAHRGQGFATMAIAWLVVPSPTRPGHVLELRRHQRRLGPRRRETRLRGAAALSDPALPSARGVVDLLGGHAGHRPVVLDGGLATELMARGHDLSDRLWSARLLPLIRTPSKTSISRTSGPAPRWRSPRATRRRSRGSGPRTGSRGSARPDAAKREPLARRARTTLPRGVRGGDRGRPTAAGRGLGGPYGAMLADGSEYRGDYDLGARRSPPSTGPGWRPWSKPARTCSRSRRSRPSARPRSSSVARRGGRPGVAELLVPGRDVTRRPANRSGEPWPSAITRASWRSGSTARRRGSCPELLARPAPSTDRSAHRLPERRRSVGCDREDVGRRPTAGYEPASGRDLDRSSARRGSVAAAAPARRRSGRLADSRCRTARRRATGEA